MARQRKSNQNGSSASLGFKAKVWLAADKVRNTTGQPVFRAFVEHRSHGTAQADVSGESIMEFDRIPASHAESRSLVAGFFTHK